MDNNAVLQIQNISKSFPGVKALEDVSVDIKRGSVHALVGENGAGKSTLIKILAGIYTPNGGSIVLNGKKVRFKAPIEAQKAGISVIHQEIKLAETLTVAENIFLGNLPHTKAGMVDWNRMYSRADELIKSLNVEIDVRTEVFRLSIAKKQIIEICKAINRDCSVIIMDEPSATLTDRELAVLFDTVKKLRSDGYTVIYISHRLDEIFDLADVATILRDGRHVDTVDVKAVTRAQLISMMVGREMGDQYPAKTNVIGDVVLEVKNLNRKGVLRDISFSVRKSEILGISGLVGSGRTELARAILGIDKIDSGEITYNGKPATWKDFKRALTYGLGLVPEDRKQQGLMLEFSVCNNISSVAIHKILRNGIVDFKLEEKYAQQFIEMLNISTPSPKTEAKNLSGGNQQKVVVAKWLLQDSDLLILDEPTRGIDVGAKKEMYTIIDRLAASGKTIIMISSEMPELIGMCDRILVINEGALVGTFNYGEASQEKIMALCV